MKIVQVHIPNTWCEKPVPQGREFCGPWTVKILVKLQICWYKEYIIVRCKGMGWRRARGEKSSKKQMDRGFPLSIWWWTWVIPAICFLLLFPPCVCFCLIFLHCRKYIIFCTDGFVISKSFHCSWSVEVPPLRNLFFHTRIVYSPQIVILRSSAHVSLLIGTLGTF